MNSRAEKLICRTDIELVPGLQGQVVVLFQETTHLNFMLGVRDFRAAVMGSD